MATSKPFLMYLLVDPRATKASQIAINDREPEHLCLCLRNEWKGLPPGYYHGQDSGPNWSPCESGDVDPEAIALFTQALAETCQEPDPVVPFDEQVAIAYATSRSSEIQVEILLESPPCAGFSAPIGDP